METSKNIFEHTNYELTQNQTYKIEDTLFIVEPVFNEEISKEDIETIKKCVMETHKTYNI